jgi:hypothetical protein
VTAAAEIGGLRFSGLMRRVRVAVRQLRRIVVDVNDLDVDERFWGMVTGLPLLVSAVGAPTRFTRRE